MDVINIDFLVKGCHRLVVARATDSLMQISRDTAN